jgi:hypothetical protein
VVLSSRTLPAQRTHHRPRLGLSCNLVELFTPLFTPAGFFTPKRCYWAFRQVVFAPLRLNSAGHAGFPSALVPYKEQKALLSLEPVADTGRALTIIRLGLQEQ